MSKCTGKKVCQNKPTKRLVDSYNAILTKLSEFFSTIIQTFSFNDRFEVKKTQIFLKSAFCLRNVPLYKQNAVLTTLLKLLLNHPKLYRSKSQNEKNKTTKVSKNHFPQSINPDTQKAILRNLSEVFR